LRSGIAGRAAQPAGADCAAQRGRVAETGREDPGDADDHPPGQHGVPVRDVVPLAVAGGVRAPDHRRDAWRRDAVHAQRRGRGAVADLRSDPHRVVAGARAARAVRSGLPGPRGGGEAAARRRRLARDLMARNDAVWSARDTTPDAIEAALRELLAQRHAENSAYVPARVLNMVVFVEDAWSGEVANRLRGVGRYHASRVIVLAYDPRRERIDAQVSIAADEPAQGELTLLRETVVLRIGPAHLDDLPTIADPLVVTDLPTLLWSPHGHA